MEESEALRLFGITLVGATPENGKKLLLTIVIVAMVVLFAMIGRRLLAGTLGQRARLNRFRFWARQAVGLVAGAVLILGIVSIWFDDPTRLTTALGLITAGVAFALQRVITAIAGYFVILRGKTFNVGDRIVMGGVRGDVIALSFMQTKILEMGQPPPVSGAEPAMWVHSRQFTGRIVTVSNDKIFDEPIYNYTYHFPYVWEEIRLPVKYGDDRAAAEAILLEAAQRHAVSQEQLDPRHSADLQRRYGIRIGDIQPKVYWRLTDNWLELAVRFLSPDHGTREIKDAMSREILSRLDAEGIGIASATFEITGLPVLKLTQDEARATT
ncbi:MAG TPA: mechanosensitive ion channel domain-containing protein [Sphingomicrobium sp.]|jgi:small-conductance mechanosensitive channel|nr:mechanosensitive ion channel domain-containing protein [Sphingomicrobium sp.]